MTLRNKKFSLAIIALAGAVAVVWLALPRPATPQPVVRGVQPRPETVAAAPAPATPEPTAEPEPEEQAVATASVMVVPAPPAPSAMISQPAALVASGPAPKPALSEAAGTAQMYAAHASLRTPEVADPDSKANRQILQTMVAKALAQPASPPVPGVR